MCNNSSFIYKSFLSQCVTFFEGCFRGAKALQIKMLCQYCYHFTSCNRNIKTWKKMPSLQWKTLSNIPYVTSNMKQHLQINSQIWPLPNKEKDDANYQKPYGVLEGTTHPLKQNKVEHLPLEFWSSKHTKYCLTSHTCRVVASSSFSS